MRLSAKFLSVNPLVRTCPNRPFRITVWRIAEFLSTHFDGGLLDGRLPRASEAIGSLHADIMTSVIVLVGVMIWRRTLTLGWFAIALSAAFIGGVYDLMDQILHALLSATGTYRFATGEGRLGLNPQYTRITVFVVASSLLSAISIRKSGRPLDRVFVLLIADAVAVTTFVFHLALPMGVLRFERGTLSEMLVEKAGYVPPDDFCASRSCVFLDPSFGLIGGIPPTQTPPPSREFVFWSIEALRGSEVSTRHVRSLSFNGTSFAVEGCTTIREPSRHGAGYMCFSDETILEGLAKTVAAWMAFLSSFAHSV